MSVKSMTSTVTQRHALAEELRLANPVLLSGEMCIETDTLKFKFGNGITPWNDLPYVNSFSPDGSDFTEILLELEELEDKVSLLEQEIESGVDLLGFEYCEANNTYNFY